MKNKNIKFLGIFLVVLVMVSGMSTVYADESMDKIGKDVQAVIEESPGSSVDIVIQTTESVDPVVLERLGLNVKNTLPKEKGYFVYATGTPDAIYKAAELEEVIHIFLDKSYEDVALEEKIFPYLLIFIGGVGLGYILKKRKK